MPCGKTSRCRAHPNVALRATSSRSSRRPCCSAVSAFTSCDAVAELLLVPVLLTGVPAVAIGGRLLTSPTMAGFGLRASEKALGQRCIAVAHYLLPLARKG